METDSSLTEYSDTDSDRDIFADYTDSKYSPLMLQKSWEYLKVSRRLAKIYHRELLKQKEIESVREAWFVAVKERMR